MANNGKWLEALIEKGLKAFQEKRPSFFHRFYDSASAGGFLPAQPGDYFWLLPDTPAILLEVKSTEKSAALKGLIKPSQFGKHRLWARAGHLSAFVYGDSAKETLCWYWGHSLASDEWLKAPAWSGELKSSAQMLDYVAQSLRG